jgi:hypothetical protein
MQRAVCACPKTRIGDVDDYIANSIQINTKTAHAYGGTVNKTTIMRIARINIAEKETIARAPSHKGFRGLSVFGDTIFFPVLAG